MACLSRLHLLEGGVFINTARASAFGCNGVLPMMIVIFDRNICKLSFELDTFLPAYNLEFHKICSSILKHTLLCILCTKCVAVTGFGCVQCFIHNILHNFV